MNHTDVSPDEKNTTTVEGYATQTDQGLPKRPKGFRSFLWYFCNILPCAVTAVILFLNIKEHVCGTNVGSSPKDTEAITASLQVASKFHEIFIMISLASIVQQMIRRASASGLKDAEKSLGDIFFIFSRGFRRPVRNFWYSKEKGRWKILRILLLIFAAIALSTVVGPSSALLMVPKIHWFLERNQEFVYNTTDSKNFRSLCYPYILIDPRIGETGAMRNIFEREPIPHYWRYSVVREGHFDLGGHSKYNTEVTHRFTDSGLPVTLNSTTIWNRTLVVGNDWKGETRFTTITRMDAALISDSLKDYLPAPNNEDSEVRFIADVTGIEANAVCRRRHKLPCTDGARAGNATEWCYMFVTKDTDDGQLLNSQDLLLVANFTLGERFTTTRLPRLWMTEGLRTNVNQKFTDSIVIVFEDYSENITESLLTVCSISATLKSATAMSTRRAFTGEQVEFHDRLDYFRSNDSTQYMPPQTILYHENWLDMIHQNTTTPGLSQGPTNATYTLRMDQNATENALLKSWAIEVLNVESGNIGSIWWNNDTLDDHEAGMVERAVGGSYLTMLSRIMPSHSQYPMPFNMDVIPYEASEPNFTTALIPEGRIGCTYIRKPVSIYHNIYGYRSRSIVKVLCMVVLLTHSTIAILGSVRQVIDDTTK